MQEAVSEGINVKYPMQICQYCSGVLQHGLHMHDMVYTSLLSALMYMLNYYMHINKDIQLYRFGM